MINAEEKNENKKLKLVTEYASNLLCSLNAFLGKRRNQRLQQQKLHWKVPLHGNVWHSSNLVHFHKKASPRMAFFTAAKL